MIRILFIITILAGSVFTTDISGVEKSNKDHNDSNRLIIKEVFNFDLNPYQFPDVTMTKLLNWEETPYVIILQKKKSSICKTDLETLKITDCLPIPSPYEADFIEVIEQFYQDIWIVQGSKDSTFLFITNVMMDNLKPKVQNTLLMPFTGAVISVQLLNTYVHSYMTVLHYNNAEQVFVSIHCLSCESNDTLLTSFETLANSKMASIMTNERIYVVVTNSSNQDYYIYHTHFRTIISFEKLTDERTQTHFIKKSDAVYTVELGRLETQEILLINETGVHHIGIWQTSQIERSFQITDSIVGILAKQTIHFYHLLDNLRMDEIWKYQLNSSLLKLESIVFDEILLIKLVCDDGVRVVILHNPFTKGLASEYDYTVDLPANSNDELEELLAFQSILRNYRHEIKSIENAIESEQQELESIRFDKFEDSYDPESFYNQPTNVLHGQFTNLRKELLEIYKEILNLSPTISNKLTYSGSQRIKSDIVVDRLVAKEVNMYKADISKINDVPIDTYKDDYLNVEDDQTVTGEFHFSILASSNATAKSLTDGIVTIRPRDFMLTNSPKQVVTGNHVYSSIVINGGAIKSPNDEVGLINGIDVSEIVLKHSNEAFTDDKEFDHTFNIIRHLSVRDINDLPYEEWKNKLMPVSPESQLLSKSVVIVGNLTVDGNVDALAVNGIDFHALGKNSAKKLATNINIEGSVQFENQLHVENLNVESVSGFKWSDVLRIQDHDVKANFHINEAFVLGDVVGPVNGIDFSKDVLLTEGNQTVEAETTFISDIEVFGPSGVTMEDGAKVNDVDPSEAATLNFGEDGIFKQKEIFNEPIEVNGDVEIHTLNGLDVRDLKHIFWTNNGTQEIGKEVVIPEAEFRQSVNTGKMNKRKLNEFLLNEGQQIITGRNIFMAPVDMDTLQPANGRTIDGVDISDFKDYVISLKEQQELNGNLDLQKVFVENLTVRKLGNFDLNKAVHSKNPIHSGSVIFHDHVTTDVLDADGSLKVLSVNGNRTEDVFGNKPNSVSVINGALTVDRLQVSDFSIDGRVNGRNITKWFEDSVFLDDKEHRIKQAHVKGKIYFEGPLQLEKVNGKLWETFADEVSLICSNCFITGRKTFKRTTDFMDNLNVDFINGINITKLFDKLLRKSRNQEVTGKYTFNEDLRASKVFARQISGIPLDQVLLVDSPGRLNGTTKFASAVKFNQIYAHHSWLAGCNLEEALTKPTFDQMYDLHSNVTFGHIHIKGDLFTRGGISSRTGRNHVTILKNLVQQSKEQEITGKVVFDTTSSISDLKTPLLNSQPTENLLADASEESAMNINCDVTFANGMKAQVFTARDVNISDHLSVNGNNIRELNNTAVDKYPNVKIGGKKHFRSELTVKGILLAKNVNNIEHNKFLTVRSDLSEQELFFDEAVIYKKLVDNSPESWNSVAKLAKRAFGFPNNNAPAVNLHVTESLYVDSINGIHLTDLVRRDGNQNITGKKTFEHLIINGETRAKIINNIFVKDLFSNNTWPYKMTNGNKDNIHETSFVPKLKSTIERINEENYKLSRSLHTKLVDISREEFMAVAGVEKLQDYRIANDKRGILAIARKPDLCLNCSCNYQTYILKVHNGEFIPDSDPHNGIYFILGIDDFAGQIFELIAGCNSNTIHTKVRNATQLPPPNLFSVQEATVYDIGLTMKARKFRVDNLLYMITLFHVADDELQLKVFFPSTSNIVSIQKFKGFIIDFDITKIGEHHHLLVISGSQKSSVERKVLTKSTHYVWNKATKRFEERFIFLDEYAASVKFVTTGDDNLLIFAEICNDYCYHFGRIGKIQIYRERSGFFEPFTVMSIGEITSVETFVVDTQLYMTVTLASNLVQLYEYKGEEGMRLMYEIAVKNPTDSSYLRDLDNHYLSIAQNKEGILLLKLNIIGVDRSIQ